MFDRVSYSNRTYLQLMIISCILLYLYTQEITLFTSDVSFLLPLFIKYEGTKQETMLLRGDIILVILRRRSYSHIKEQE